MTTENDRKSAENDRGQEPKTETMRVSSDVEIRGTGKTENNDRREEPTTDTMRVGSDVEIRGAGKTEKKEQTPATEKLRDGAKA